MTTFTKWQLGYDIYYDKITADKNKVIKVIML